MDQIVIEKVVVANRGEIAIRIFHTIHEMNLRSVALYTDADEEASHTRSAHERRRISNYLDAEAIVREAQACGADAIHPGYGFLSESAEFAAACARAGLAFIGPSAETIRSMGDKLESKRIMQTAGVPTTPAWNSNPPESEYPVLVKAVGGGGGKGMRVVHHPADLENAMASASREAENAFHDGRVFIEKYIQRPRHIEFQILADSHGNILHLFERECSIQRRHQKVIEETPSLAVSDALRTEMGSAAVRAAAAVKYCGAGTIEFILDDSGRYYFVEMNTRLQVEHAITEATAGLDLVREQISIAEGRALRWKQSDITRRGHAIECRIYAEVPEEGFRPSTGEILVYSAPSGPGVRIDSGVDVGSRIGIDYDPMLAKVIVLAESRDSAIDRMKDALRAFAILGVETNIEFLQRVISSDDFRSGNVDVQFLERRHDLLQAPVTEIPPIVLLGASIVSSSPHNLHADRESAWRSGHWRNT